MKKFLLIIGIIFMLGIISVGNWFYGISTKIFVNHGKVSANDNTIQQHLSSKSPVNFVLLGYGGGNHDGAYLTDSIIVVHIDQLLRKIFLISIPRDLWIKIPTDGNDGSYWKINASYEIGLNDIDFPNKQKQFTGQNGGGRLVEYMVSQVTGLPINNFIGLDFSGFKHTIDTLGGVNINVQPGFTDPQYPIDGKENDLCGHQTSDFLQLDTQTSQSAIEKIYPCRYKVLHFDAGMQHMNGGTALSYVRSRHSVQDGTDFGRANRQRKLLIALKEQLFSTNFLPHSVSFISSLGDDLRTDMSFEDVKSFIENANLFKKYSIETIAITDKNFLIDAQSNDGQEILEPSDGPDNLTNIKNYITNTINGSNNSVSAIIQIANHTLVPGLASVAENRLNNENMHTVASIDTTNTLLQHTIIYAYDKNINPTELSNIKKEFSVKDIIYTSDEQNEYNVRVEIGNDYNTKEGKKLLNEP